MSYRMPRSAEQLSSRVLIPFASAFFVLSAWIAIEATLMNMTLTAASWGFVDYVVNGAVMYVGALGAMVSLWTIDRRLKGEL